MKKILLLVAAVTMLYSCEGPFDGVKVVEGDEPTTSSVTYNNQRVTINSDYIRTQCGTTKSNIVKEVSGLACSRTTAGYLWAEIDEGTSYLYALSPDGSLKTKLTVEGMNNRDDWEDICTGTYNGVNYIFVGAFGDNNATHADDYYIVCIPEPALTSTEVSAKATIIKFGFPNHVAYNVETLMYDSANKMFYIVNKVDGVANIFKLPMSLTYGSALQTLTEGPALGTTYDKWSLITGGDISPDGSLVAIKNKSQIFLWKRQGAEDVFTTVARAPELIGSYQQEAQGESLAWLDNNTFYTTSDSKIDTPIYKYSK